MQNTQKVVLVGLLVLAVVAAVTSPSAGYRRRGITVAARLAVPDSGTSYGRIDLGSPAPPGGKTFNLTSTDSNVASVPSSYTIPAGSSSG